MSELPGKIKTTILVDGYYEIQRPDRDILDELVTTINSLIDFLEAAPIPEDKETLK